MWRQNGTANQYLYHPDQPTNFGQNLPWSTQFQSGRWHTLRTRITLNTPGRRDGQIQTWLDDHLVLDQRNIRLRDTENLRIDKLSFSTFYGGNTPAWAPSRNEHIDFDNFTISAPQTSGINIAG